MIVQRAALITAGPLAALGLSAGLAHADPVDLFSGDDISITAPDGLGTGVVVGGLAPIDTAYEYANPGIEINGATFPDVANVYSTTDLFGGSETLVDLNPGQSVADSDVFSTFSFANGSILLEHAYIGDALAAGLPTDVSDIGSYDALVVDGTTFALPESLSNLLGPDFGLTALDVAVLSAQASDVAATLDLTPLLDVFTSAF
jgi:hypothetical protein